MKILGLSDFGINSGFGRIANNTFVRLQQRGHQVMGASLYWDGMHPTHLPFYVFPLAGHDVWSYFASLVNEHKPDAVVVCQDFPYSYTTYHALRLDFSRFKFIIITPIDGKPIFARWVELAEEADGLLVISRFGVEALRQAGRHADLLHPGVNQTEFYPVTAEEKAALREKAGIPQDAFVLGTMCMNQGRKAIPLMLQGFYEFARDKKDCFYVMDMEKEGQGGWSVPVLIESMGADPKKVLFKADLEAKGLSDLNQRYNVLDVHTVLSHREGFGLPLLESMACRVATAAMDWCSGTEIVGEGRGLLIKTIPQKYLRYGTWGNAVDYDPDIDDFVDQLNTVYYNPAERSALAERGYQWAIKQTWDAATDQLEATLKRAMTTQKQRVPKAVPQLILRPTPIRPAGLDISQGDLPIPPTPATEEAQDSKSEGVPSDEKVVQAT